MIIAAQMVGISRSAKLALCPASRGVPAALWDLTGAVCGLRLVRTMGRAFFEIAGGAILWPKGTIPQGGVVARKTWPPYSSLLDGGAAAALSPHHFLQGAAHV